MNGRHSHDFAALFENLTEQTKQNLLSKFSTELSIRNNTDIRALEESMSIVVSKDLKTNLSHWASVFVDLRYAFDFMDKYKGKEKTMMFFPEIRNAIYNAIISHESTWEP